MPLYDYVCTACATRIEVMHGVHKSGPALCTVCGGAMRKALSSPAIVFKGSGWAKKDARDKSSGSSGASDSSSSSKSEPTTAKSSDGGAAAG